MELDSVFRALSHRVRRDILCRLVDSGETTLSIEEIVASVTADADDQTDIRIELHHTHLSLLRDCGLITYDVQKGQVSLCALPELVAEICSLLRENTTTE
jgi:DNA-binding transcriptional ArsR family regulator